MVLSSYSLVPLARKEWFALFTLVYCSLAKKSTRMKLLKELRQLEIDLGFVIRAAMLF